MSALSGLMRYGLETCLEMWQISECRPLPPKIVNWHAWVYAGTRILRYWKFVPLFQGQGSKEGRKEARDCRKRNNVDLKGFLPLHAIHWHIRVAARGLAPQKLESPSHSEHSSEIHCHNIIRPNFFFMRYKMNPKQEPKSAPEWNKPHATETISLALDYH